jgi:hypothetical protein
MYVNKCHLGLVGFWTSLSCEHIKKVTVFQELGLFPCLGKRVGDAPTYSDPTGGTTVCHWRTYVH